MPQDLSLFLTQTIARELPNLRAVDDNRAAIPRGPGKWSPREELGHLIDSAANNHQRFVRAQSTPRLEFLNYEQEFWVAT